MRVLVGTSGFGHSEWNGRFYPGDLPGSHRLGYYALRLPTVEVSRTSSGLPQPEVLQHWASVTPSHFVFALEAPRQLTQLVRPDAACDGVRALYSAAQLLGHKLGPVVFQCPARLRRDVAALAQFLSGLPSAARAVLDLRGDSRMPEVRSVLEQHGVALCISDEEGVEPSRPSVVATAPFGYIRLCRSSYSDDALEAWAETIAAQPWQVAFVIFAPQDKSLAPKMGLRMLEFAEAAEEPIKPLVKRKPSVTASAAAIGPRTASADALQEPRLRPIAKARRSRRTRWRTRSKG